jgi:YfiH family protein
MPFIESKNLKYFTFPGFGKELKYGIFTRHGGVSPTPWDSLNIGGTVGDDPERVFTNRKRMMDILLLSESSVYDCWQVHSNQVIKVDHPRKQGAPYEKGDALITNNPEVTLLMRFADCTPILLYDSDKKVIGMVHSGWVGTIKKVIQYTIRDMIKNYGCKPANITAGIGPSIGLDHYEVGIDVVDKVKEAFADQANNLIKHTNGKYFFDLWEANRQLLFDCGVTNVEISGICTACHTDDWYSHRAEKGKTGRFGAALSLKRK